MRLHLDTASGNMKALIRNTLANVLISKLLEARVIQEIIVVVSHNDLNESLQKIEISLIFKEVSLSICDRAETIQCFRQVRVNEAVRDVKCRDTWRGLNPGVNGEVLVPRGGYDLHRVSWVGQSWIPVKG